MNCPFCENKKILQDEKCPRCGKRYDESGYLNTAEKHKDWYGMRPGKTRNNPNPNRKEPRK